ncbi:MAG: LysM peptidoglycan-binding domain-containing protein, partial [Alphaproteobacteria bacterium]
MRKGDTVYGISRRYHVDLAALVTANGLKPPYRLQPGQRLVLPLARQYRVRRGDTLFAIARRFDVPQRSLAAANRLKRPYRLRLGQKLVIPTGRGEGLAVAGRAGDRLGPPPALAAGGFDWPVTGRVISRFGPKAQGLR